MPLPFRLKNIAETLESEIKQVQNVFTECHSHTPVSGFSTQYGAGEDGCIVAMWDAWNRFMRNLYLTSCASESIGDSGIQYRPTTTYSEAAALSHLRANRSGTNIRFTRSEPNWFDTAAVGDYCRILSLPNAAVITGAVLTSSIVDMTGTSSRNPIQNIRKLRNFIAHKNQDTRKDISVFVADPGHTRLFLKAPVRGGVSQFDDWANGLIGISYAAVQ